MKFKKSIYCFLLIISILTLTCFADEPTIIVQPQNVYLPYNTSFPASVSFSVLASGDDLTYQWQISNSDGVWTNSTGTGATTNSLKSTAYQNGANGKVKYRVIVSNNDGSTISSVASYSVGFYLFDTLEQFLSFINDTVNFIFQWALSCCNCIVSEPLLLFTVGFLAVGACIALVSRFLARS